MNRLQEIKQRLSTISPLSKDPYETLEKISCDDLYWLISQAEELEHITARKVDNEDEFESRPN